MTTKQTTAELLRSPDVLDGLNANRPVSSASMFNDPRWSMDAFGPSLPNGGLTLYWRPGFEVPDGEEPDEVDRAIDLDLRRMVWVTLADPSIPTARKLTGASSLVAGCLSLRIFMRERGLASLADLTPAVIEIYVAWLEVHCASDKQETQSKDQTDSDFEADPADEERELERLASRIQLRLQTISLIWKVRETLIGVRVPIPAADPLGGRSIREVAGSAVRRIDDRIPPVPDEVFVRMANACMSLIERHSDEILSLQRDWLAKVGPDLGGQTSRKDAAIELRSVRLSSAGDTSLIYPRDLTEDLDDPTGSVWAPLGLRRLIVALRDACLFTIQSGAGLRTGELLSIAGGRRADAELPDCVVRRRTSDNLFDMFFVVSILDKGRTTPVLTEWLLGMAPVGSTSLPPAVRAVVVLEELSSPWRAFSDDPFCKEALTVAFAMGGGLPMEPGRVFRLTTGRYAHSTGNLVRRHVNLSDLPDRGADGKDLRPYLKDPGSCIRPAQYRKNFAKFVYRTDSRLITALKAHFKHMHLATTERSYVGALAADLIDGNDERHLLSGMAFRALLGDEPDFAYGGSLARTISRDVDRFDLERKPTKDELEGFIEAGGLLWPGEHGSCGCALAPTLSRCNRLAGTASFVNTTPNPKYRSPQTCIGCPLFLTDRSHLPYWRRRYLVNRRSWLQACRNGVAADFEVARQRAEMSMTMLRRLGWERAK